LGEWRLVDAKLDTGAELDAAEWNMLRWRRPLQSRRHSVQWRT
jgi:hypothetical protein